MNEEVKSVFRFNAHVINKNLEDINQEESLVTASSGGPSINWILGHIILTRDYLQELLGIENTCDEKFEKIYSRGVDSVSTSDAIDVKELLKIFNESQIKIMKALDEIDIRSDKDMMDNIPGLSFHEAYHAGQTGILRRVIGKKGVI